MSNKSIMGEVIKTGYRNINQLLDKSGKNIDYSCDTCTGINCDICRVKYRVWDNDNIIYCGIRKEIAVREAGYDFTK